MSTTLAVSVKDTLRIKRSCVWVWNVVLVPFKFRSTRNVPKVIGGHDSCDS
jgi:hypothetical protein